MSEGYGGARREKAVPKGDLFAQAELSNRANDGSGVEVSVTSEPQAMELWGGRQGSGMMAMAQMPDEEFEARLAMLEKGTSRIQQIKKSLMKEGVHFGVIPGTKKPSLLKPGAEVLCNVYGLRPDFIVTTEYGDGITAPPIRVTLRAEMHLGDLDGPVVGVGLGAASSWERRYRYRRGERACPACGALGSVIKGKAEFGGGWLCWAKKGGCGAKFEDDDAEITSQVMGDVENQDQHDLLNTLIKMGAKRSQIDGALRVTGSSDLFTQDVEEGVSGADEESDTAGDETAPDREATPVPKQAQPVPVRNVGSTAKDVQEFLRREAPPAPRPTSRTEGVSSAKPVTQPAAKPGARPTCTRCGNSRTVIANKFDGGWVCWKNAKPTPGCGHKWADAGVATEPEGDNYEVQDSDVPF